MFEKLYATITISTACICTALVSILAFNERDASPAGESLYQVHTLVPLNLIC